MSRISHETQRCQQRHRPQGTAWPENTCGGRHSVSEGLSLVTQRALEGFNYSTVAEGGQEQNKVSLFLVTNEEHLSLAFPLLCVNTYETALNFKGHIWPIASSGSAFLSVPSQPLRELCSG